MSDNSDDEEQNDDYIKISSIDQNDLIAIIENLIPEAPQFGLFLVDQIHNGQGGDPHKRRWHKSVISMYLTLWAK